MMMSLCTYITVGVLYVMHMSTLELFDTGQRVSRVSGRPPYLAYSTVQAISLYMFNRVLTHLSSLH